MLNRIQVGRLRGPLQNFQTALHKPFLRHFGSVFRVVVVLENRVRNFVLVVLQRVKEVRLQDATVVFGVHVPFYTANVAGTIGAEAAPNHDGTSAVFKRGGDMLGEQRRTTLSPAVFASI